MALSRITAASIEDGTVVAADIADGAVTGPKLGATSINANNIVTGAVTGDKLGATSINANNIVDGSVTGVKLGLTSINANNIVDNSITSAKLDTSIFATTSNIFGVTANSNTFSNTIIIVAGNTAPINVGMLVSGSNVTPGTTVLSFNSSPPSGRSNITLSAATVGTNTNTAFSFYETNKVLSPGIAGPGLCKAWVNFNGTGDVQIRAAYNVSSITDNGTGDYTVNFTTAMPDANYAAVMTAETTLAAGIFADLMGVVNGGRVAGSVRITCINSTDATNERDPTAAMVSIFR